MDTLVRKLRRRYYYYYLLFLTFNYLLPITPNLLPIYRQVLTLTFHVLFCLRFSSYYGLKFQLNLNLLPQNIQLNLLRVHVHISLICISYAKAYFRYQSQFENSISIYFRTDNDIRRLKIQFQIFPTSDDKRRGELKVGRYDCLDRLIFFAEKCTI